MASYDDIPKFTRSSAYAVTAHWAYLQHHMATHMDEWLLDLDPDFQRGYVWTEEQQRKYVEYILRGGKSGRDLYTNCPGWQRGKVGNYVMVDGKQRLTAVLTYLDNKLAIFGGHYARDFGRRPPTDAYFTWHVNDLGTRAEVLQWYLDMNSGGTIHTEEDLSKVEVLLAADRENPVVYTFEPEPEPPPRIVQAPSLLPKHKAPGKRK